MLRGLGGPGGRRPSPAVTCAFTCPPLAPPPASLLTWAGRTPAAAARWGQREVSRDDKPGWTKGLLGPGPPCCPGEVLGPGGRGEVHAQGFVKMRPRAGTWGRGGGAPSQSFRASASATAGEAPTAARPVGAAAPALRCRGGARLVFSVPTTDQRRGGAESAGEGRGEGEGPEGGKERRKRKKKKRQHRFPPMRTRRSGWGGQRGR